MIAQQLGEDSAEPGDRHGGSAAAEHGAHGPVVGEVFDHGERRPRARLGVWGGRLLLVVGERLSELLPEVVEAAKEEFLLVLKGA